MPNGKTHDTITLITLPLVVVSSHYFLSEIKEMIIIIISYLFSSIMFNGDLDTVSKPYNRWFILKMIWIPYQLMFNHRSIFTHGIIIGTIIRILYISIIPIMYLISTNQINLIYMIDLRLLLITFIGLEIGSSIHTISDRLF